MPRRRRCTNKRAIAHCRALVAPSREGDDAEIVDGLIRRRPHPSEAERLGKITVGTELGWGKAVSPEGVRYGRQGVLAAAINNELINGRIEPIAHHKDGTQRKVELVDRECFTVAPFEGHYEPLLECGANVRRDDVVGLLHDFDHIDREPWPARAGVDGVVVAQAWVAPIQRGQHIIVVGRQC